MLKAWIHRCVCRTAVCTAANQKFRYTLSGFAAALSGPRSSGVGAAQEAGGDGLGRKLRPPACALPQALVLKKCEGRGV